MAETRSQKIARLQNEINMAEDTARTTLERAERKREEIYRMAHRPAEPTESKMFASRIKFKGTAVLYTFLFLKTPVGWYTTGSGRNANFRTWDALLDWFDGEDIESHTGLEMLVETGELMIPQRERVGYPL